VRELLKEGRTHLATLFFPSLLKISKAKCGLSMLTVWFEGERPYFNN
jgi:hypothetical protein